MDDISLLREYVEHGSEEAFAALVTRHVSKVYSIALRHTRNPHQAEEIAQAVFVILARQARRLSSRVILAGWLCRTAQLTAVTFVRSEIRRARREQEAYMQNQSLENEPDVWPQIAPLLDTAMAGLNEIDHHAVALRFFDGKSMKEVGAALGASEDAAKMRVNRAVEKLRLFFTKRGIVVSAAVLTVAISANSVQCAPATLARTATAVALAKGTTASTPTLTLSKEVLKIMAWTKAKMAIVAAAVALIVTGTATVVVKNVSHQNQNMSHPITAASASPLKDPSLAVIQRDGAPDRPLPQHDPNARFANLTPEQRVEQARQHYPQSVDDLKK
ncbi:MAG TPA: sigma-70 family RNA polymerase sigma factor [Verrucomicrobiae bacterium]